VSFVDAQVGKVLDQLDRLGLAERTIVVLWGDHGFKLGEHGGWGKLTHFELDARVPLIVRAPGAATAGARVSGLVELVDLYPTLADLAGLPLPQHLEGDSFVPLLTQPTRSWKEAVFGQCSRDDWMGHAIRTQRHRFVVWSKPGEPSSHELYDLVNDPGETHNVAGEPAFLAIQRELNEQLQSGWGAFRPGR
jgi:arylsulfatase A-like enzyme